MINDEDFNYVCNGVEELIAKLNEINIRISSYNAEYWSDTKLTREQRERIADLEKRLKKALSKF
jgi:hypothetical protein